MPEIWCQSSPQDRTISALSLHIQLPTPAALKQGVELAGGRSPRTSPCEGAHASAGACCQKGSFSPYLLGLRRSTLRLTCQQPTVLKTKKVQRECSAELLTDHHLLKQCDISGSSNTKRHGKWCGGAWPSLQPVLPCCAFPPAPLHSPPCAPCEGSQELKAGSGGSSGKLLPSAASSPCNSPSHLLFPLHNQRCTGRCLLGRPPGAAGRLART